MQSGQLVTLLVSISSAAIPGTGCLQGQDLRTIPVERIGDARLAARLATAADSLQLFRLALPVALDSLRASADSTWPRLLVVRGLDGDRARAWLLSLIGRGGIRGICAPIRERCSGFDGVSAALENEPGLGDNTVRLVLSLVAIHARPEPLRLDDRQRRWVEMLKIGIPMDVPLPGARPIDGDYDTFQLVPEYVLGVAAETDGWHITRWKREPPI